MAITDTKVRTVLGNLISNAFAAHLPTNKSSTVKSPIYFVSYEWRHA